MTQQILRIFVYGTLKHGQRNFDAHCFDALAIRPATVHGRLLKRHTGTPILSLQPQTILAIGTDDPIADLRTQQFAPPPKTQHNESHKDIVRGELIEFPDAAQALQRLDHLEGFRPAGNDSLYERFLIHLADPPHQAIWTYAIPRSRRESDYSPAPDQHHWTPDW